MAITIKDVEHIAKLAKLEFTEAEKEKFTHQMNQILEYMKQLNRIDTSNVEPLSHVIELSNVFRSDEVISKHFAQKKHLKMHRQRLKSSLKFQK